jgi:hypothetical protein
MKRPDLPRLAVVLLVAVVGCTSATPTVITASTDRAVARLPDLEDPGELEEALVSFGKCVEESFPIVMRFRADPFVGLSTEVGSQRKEDGDRVDDVVANCMAQLDLDRRLSVYQSEHPASPDQQGELLDDFISCASGISTEISDRVSESNLDFGSVMGFVAEVGPPTAGLPGEDLVAVTKCMEEITGPERVFMNGHPWFTP